MDIKEVYDAIYLTKPTSPPKFDVGDIVQAGSNGITGRVVGIRWGDYSGDYFYLLEEMDGYKTFAKSEGVLIKL